MKFQNYQFCKKLRFSGSILALALGVGLTPLYAQQSSTASAPAAAPIASAPDNSTPPAGTAPATDLDSLTPVSPSSVIYDPSQAGQAYVLGPGDTLSIKVMPQDKYSMDSEPIAQDGTFFYPRIGQVDASGMTVLQLTQQLEQKLSAFCVNPDVTVSLIALRPQVVYISGGVQEPKVLDVRAASNLAKAITLAGGPVDKFMLTRVAVIRQDKVLNANVYPILVDGTDNGQNLKLQPGDLVVVPINTAKITVLGAVTTPGTFPMDQRSSSIEGPMRLSDALSKAGGTDKHSAARVGQVSIIRATGSTRQAQVTTYDYNKYLTKGDLDDNPVLQDNDIVDVPESRHTDPSALIPFYYLLAPFLHL